MLQRLYAIFQNTFFTALVLLVVLILSLVAAISAVLLLPTSIGEKPANLHVDEMYYFTSLNLETFDYLEVDYDSSGFLIPAYTRSGNVKGVSIIAEGDYYFFPENSSYRGQGSLTELYIPMNEEQLALLLIRADFIEITNRNQIISASNEVFSLEDSTEYFDIVRNQAYNLMAKESDMYISVHLFGYKRVYLPDSNIRLALLVTSAKDELVYTENQTITLYNSQTNEELFRTNHPYSTHDYPPKNLMMYALLILSLLLFASVIVVWLLTIDLDERKRIQELVKHVEYPHWLVFLALALYFTSQFLLMPASLDAYWKPTLTILMYVLILLVFCKNTYERQYIGLTLNHWGHAISSAILIGFFFQSLGSFNIPSSFAIPSYTDLLVMFASVFFFQALLNEIVFRGIIQNYIERLTNTFFAITGTAGIVALINFVLNQYIHQMLQTEVLIQAFLIAPVGSVVLSLLYVRTRSLLASSLLATLLILLPRVLVF